MRHTILCVDDEPDNVDALERLFRKRYDILKATSGEQALGLLREHAPSLIISDQRMPSMTGVEFLAKSTKLHPDSMRILLTGYTDIESVIDAINSGQVYRYVTKTLDSAKTQFMLLINHELKTPLTVMLSYLELLQESDLDAEKRKFLDRISQSADRLQVLISDSLELVSAEAGTLKIRTAKTTTSEILSSLVEDKSVALAARGLSLNVSDPKIKFRADSQILRNVLQRLLDNAVKFAKEKTEISLSAYEEGKGVAFEIVNQGKSLSKDKIEKILQPFSLDEDILHHSKGTGLGLSVCQALLHRHNSELHIECPTGRFRASFHVRTSDD
jgi:two-component system sensor histidine kinase/response regulator